MIIPVQCEYLALEGLSLLLNTIQQVRAVLNEQLVIAGVVLTMYDSRTNLSQQVIDEVRKFFPRESYQTIIPRNIRLSEAPSHGKTIFSYAPHSAGALAYQALAQEFLARIEGAAERRREAMSSDLKRRGLGRGLGALIVSTETFSDDSTGTGTAATLHAGVHRCASQRCSQTPTSRGRTSTPPPSWNWRPPSAPTASSSRWW